jgi:hypothetical protein
MVRAISYKSAVFWMIPLQSSNGARWQNSAPKVHNGRRDNQDLRLRLSARRAVSRSRRAAMRSLAQLENSLCQLPQHKNRPKSKKQLTTASVVARFYWISITQSRTTCQKIRNWKSDFSRDGSLNHRLWS